MTTVLFILCFVLIGFALSLWNFKVTRRESSGLDYPPVIHESDAQFIHNHAIRNDALCMCGKCRHTPHLARTIDIEECHRCHNQGTISGMVVLGQPAKYYCADTCDPYQRQQRARH